MYLQLWSNLILIDISHYVCLFIWLKKEKEKNRFILRTNFILIYIAFDIFSYKMDKMYFVSF